jgi:hypothetical protein
MFSKRCTRTSLRKCPKSLGLHSSENPRRAPADAERTRERDGVQKSAVEHPKQITR